MIALFRSEFTVPDSSVDELGHVNNLEYLRWMVEAAKGHSEANGWPQARYLDLGAAWVVRAHHVHYDRPAFAGERLVVETWVTAMTRVTSRRRYRLTRAEDGARIAHGETDWVFVRLDQGRPHEIPPDVRAAYPVVRERAEAAG